MKKRTGLFIPTALALVLFFSFGYLSEVKSAEPLILKYAGFSKAGTSRTRAAEDTMKEIEKRTGGRVKHEFYWAQSLLKHKNILMGIKKGTCDLGNASAIPYHRTRCPAWQFTQLLFVSGHDPYAHTKACNELYYFGRKPSLFILE